MALSYTPKSTVTVRAVRYALNGPGGNVRAWRDDAAPAILSLIKKDAPVNHVLNANGANRRYGSGVVGTYKNMLSYQKSGNQLGLGMKFVAGAKHSRFVETGRKGSWSNQSFSRAEINPSLKKKHHKVTRKPGVSYKWGYTNGRAGSLYKGKPGGFLRECSEDWLLYAVNQINGPRA